MSTRRRRDKVTHQRHRERRLEAIRTALADKYGNLYGIELDDWFFFNGEIAKVRGAGWRERKENLLRFEERLAGFRNALGQSSHRARRKAERAKATA